MGAIRTSAGSTGTGVTKRDRVGWVMGGRGWRRDGRVSRLTSAVCLPHLQGPSPVTLQLTPPLSLQLVPNESVKVA